MSLSRSIVVVRAALAGLAVLWLAGCASGSSVSQAYKAELGEIEVATDNSRISQLYRQKLNRLLDRYEPSDIRYKLDIGLSTTESDTSVSMTATLLLYDRSIGETVLTRSMNSSASIGAVPSLYGSEEAKRHARERLAGQLAEESYHFLMLHFSRQAAAEAS